VNGGKFLTGFITGGLSKLATFGTNMLAGDTLGSKIVQGLAVATVGGAITALAGGSFEAGFIMAGLAFAVHALASKAGGGRSANAKRLHNARFGRSPGQVYLTGHKVGGVGPLHMAIEYTDANGDITVISAGPGSGNHSVLLYSDTGPGGYDGTSDLPSNNHTLSVIVPPAGVTAQQYIADLVAADLNYGDNLNYTLNPHNPFRHNSNSYVTGLVGTTGGTTPSFDMSSTVGGDSPVPSCNFSPSGC